MRIAVISETSAVARNSEILAALQGWNNEVLNVGMTQCDSQPELQYIHTGLLAALLLNLNRVDLAVGGCGTGQGFLNAAMQYPGVFCGHILTPLDAWLFRQINDGNCISLALNQGYGWASDVNLKMIFEKFFEVEAGQGYPSHREGPQRQSRHTLLEINRLTHRPLSEIIVSLPSGVIHPVLHYPGVLELIDIPRIEDVLVRQALEFKLDK